MQYQSSLRSTRSSGAVTQIASDAWDRHPRTLFDLHAIEHTLTQHEEIDLQTVSGVDELEGRTRLDGKAGALDWDIELGVHTLEQRRAVSTHERDRDVDIDGRPRLADQRAGQGTAKRVGDAEIVQNRCHSTDKGKRNVDHARRTSSE